MKTKNAKNAELEVVSRRSTEPMQAHRNRCALCRDLADLRRSHIIPEFLHRPVYDDDHSTQVIAYGAERATTLRKGLRERLLCDRCEGQLQSYEDYFARAWRDHPILNGKLDGQDFTLHGLDYRKTKLFLLSILWRASVSTLPDFSQVSLGPHEDRIRVMLLRNDPGDPLDYRVIAGLIWDPVTKLRWDNIVMRPVRMRINGGFIYRIVFAGASWTIAVSRHTKLDFDPNWLTEDGALHLTCCPPDRFSKLSGAAQAVAGLRDDIY
jgi:hypothetical protein